ncbi:MAG: hypothetical protein VXY56_03720, partial [Pseudomonadota bacterium]|nr:hypothetical protein [Pseudomonadota bacterium]
MASSSSDFDNITFTLYILLLNCSGNSKNMENLSTASSIRSSVDQPRPPKNPKYERVFADTAGWYSNPLRRIEANKRAIASLKLQNRSRLIESYFFSYRGPQEDNQHFRETFVKFFQYLRGSDPLAMSAGVALADKFRGYQDVSRRQEDIIDGGDFSDIQTVSYSPTQEVITELKKIIEDNHGLKDFFLALLQRHRFSISKEFKLEDRDTCLREFPLFPRIYPRCADVLKDVFVDILKEEWLQRDINGIKYYLDENNYIDRPIADIESKMGSIQLWEFVKQAAQDKIRHDEALNKRFYGELKNDIKNLAISGGLSFCTGNPAFFAGGVGRTVINTLGDYSDPEGKQSSIQMMKLLGGGGLGVALGCDVFEIGTSMGIDLVDYAVRDDKTSKNEGTALSVYSSVLKGLFTGDKQKLIAQILGTCVAETAERVDEKNAPLDIKIALALLKNPDTRGF